MATPNFTPDGQGAAPTTPMPTGNGAVIRTKLQLVDLAGSECVGKLQ